MEDQIIPLGPDDTFRFSCTPRVSCFNQCCRDLNQFLTPYDILGIKSYLKLTSGEFLEKYTLCHDGPQTGLPVITLKPADTTRKKCPFVTSEGCAVYPARPSSCRIYPVMRAAVRSRSGDRPREHFALVREAHCQGHSGKRTWRVAEWFSDQNLDIGLEMNDLFLEIIRLQNRRGLAPLDTESRRLFHLGLYDLDAFRKRIASEDFNRDHPSDPEKFSLLKNDDVALLRFAHRWVMETVFNHHLSGDR